MNQLLTQTIQQVSNTVLSEERKGVAQPLINFVVDKINKNQLVQLNFICTHNSRRSHLSQIWAQTMAFHFGIDHVYCYSGGTEATALFPKVVEILNQQGFQIQKLSDSINPVYAINFDVNAAPISGFSKTFDDLFNPSTNFAAILTCSAADEGCPFIAGAEMRIPIRYDDPKIYDTTPEMDAKYAERSLEIAAEMYYVFSQINQQCQQKNAYIF